MKHREAQLYQWLAENCQLPQPKLKLLAGDASFRRYFRVESDSSSQTEILVDAPPPESPEPFHSVALAYQAQGIRVPQVYRVDQAFGVFLIEDLGDQLLLVGTTSAEQSYQQAIRLLPAVMRVKETRLGTLPKYSETLLSQENELFIDWLVYRHLGLQLTTAEQKVWQDFTRCITHNALAQPQVGVHRDFHSRNLMTLASGQLAVIDFQDAVIGPITYDLVSLLRDCYVRWPQSWVQNKCQQAFQHFQKEGMLTPEIHFEQFMHWFDYMGLQRHTKASGIFARLYHRDSKPTYLNDIPLTLNYLIEVSQKYPELSTYHQLLLDKVQPALEKRMSQAE